MNLRDGRRSWPCILSTYTVSSLMALAALTCAAQPAPAQRLRIVGGLAGVSQYTLHEERFWARDLARLSDGKYSASIVPFNQAGVPGTEMLNLMKLGVIPFGTALLGLMSNEYPELGAADLAGLSSDMPTLRRVVAGFRPYLETTLRERHGIQLLALYIYPAQVVFCKQPLNRLSDLAGRRTRVSSAPQADFIRALNGTPILTDFSELMTHMKSGNTDCAITGAMSGHSLGLHHVTTSLYNMPINWGLAAFSANAGAWNALPADLKTLLQRELPKLEAAVWAESERETGEGVACDTGAGACARQDKGSMTEVRPSVEDKQRSKDLFASSVLPGWAQRCGPTCAQVWDQTIGPVVGIKAPAVR